MRRVVLTVLDLLLVALKPSVQIDDGNITGRDPKGASIAGSTRVVGIRANLEGRFTRILGRGGIS
jgi:hypothetical protein